MLRQRRRARCQRGGVLAEFGPVLWLFLLIFLLPFVDLISFGTAIGTVMFMSAMGAHQVAGAATWGDGLRTLSQVEALGGPFLAFSLSKPIGPTGLKLAVLVTPVD